MQHRCRQEKSPPTAEGSRSRQDQDHGDLEERALRDRCSEGPPIPHARNASCNFLDDTVVAASDERRTAMAVSRFAVLVVAIVFVPFPIASLAHQHHGPGWYGYGTAPMYNARTEASFTGVVTSVKRVPASGQHCWGAADVNGAHLTFETATETIEVHLGPVAILEAKNVTIANGDTLTILGSRITLGGTPVLLAREISRGDQTWTLRNPAGWPLWNDCDGFPYGRYHHP
jgi:hypothetical protein